MRIVIDGNAKEIVEFVLAVQNWQKTPAIEVRTAKTIEDKKLLERFAFERMAQEGGELDAETDQA